MACGRREGTEKELSKAMDVKVIHILLISYSQSLFAIVMLYKIATNIELGNTETLLIGKIRG